jgi:hypothetical protein
MGWATQRQSSRKLLTPARTVRRGEYINLPLLHYDILVTASATVQSAALVLYASPLPHVDTQWATACTACISHYCMQIICIA